MGNCNTTATSLTPSRRQFIELMRRVNFAIIENLPIRAGQPVLDDPDIMVHVQTKFASNPDQHHTAELLQKREVLDLLVYFDRFPDCTIDRLEVQNGRPYRMSRRWSASDLLA